ncbi:MAG: aldolase/citrate lyase family protein, partial [Bacteroidales bacterium]|nr:aldolase/citrate lyase family protein [Bacteroidales bacterium]
MKPVARSLLFVPGDRPDRFDKAAASGAHQVIIDLEDAVAPSAKSAARDAVATWLAQGHSAAVRINAADTPWFADDLDMIRSIPAATVMLPKADADSLSHTSAALPGCPLIALIETVRGYMDLRQLGSVRQLTRMAFGSVDFGVETSIADE